jgi:uncharacterized phage-associated protein
MPSAVDSVFDIAFWFSDRALNENEYLQPVKLQYLLYLSQSYFAVAYNGKRLVPAIFIAEEAGPLEPSVNRAWTRGRPTFDGDGPLTEEVKAFVDSVWRRFGHHSAEYLAKMCTRTPAYQAALRRGSRAEISLEHMMDDFTRAHDTPDVKSVVKPKVVRSQTGKAVSVKAWDPRVLGSSKK